MKKYALSGLAMILAITFSAFTSRVTTEQTVWYQIDGAGQWYSTVLEPCDPGPVSECLKITPDGRQKIFDAANGNPFTSQP